MSAEIHNSYGRILKSTAFLGGSSVFDVGLGILRTKVLAVQLGPAMFGVLGLYTSLTTMIGGVASLGIGQSAVSDIAAAAGSKDQARIARTTRIFRRLVWGTGLLGLFMTLALAYPASGWSFGNHDHVWAIAVLSVTVLFAQIGAGQMALLQGLRRIRDLTAARITGAVCSTVVAIGILLWLRERGIVAFLVVVALGQLVTSWWFAHRVRVVPVMISWRETWEQSRKMVSLGLAVVGSGLAVSASMYVIRLIIQHYAGAAGVGLYQSAFTISGTYVSFILQAMASDYYPRLAEVVTDIQKRNRIVKEQAEMALLLAMPGLVAALVLSGPLIRVLYSSRFAGAEDILRWQVLGLLGQIISWPLGYLLLASADKITLLWTEIVTNAAHVGLVLLGVSFFGLVGAGAAFAALYLFYVVLIYLVVSCRHGYRWQKSTGNLVLLGTLLVGAAFGTTFIENVVWRLTVGVLVLVVAAVFSFRGMVERLGHERVTMVRCAVARWLGLLRR